MPKSEVIFQNDTQIILKKQVNDSMKDRNKRIDIDKKFHYFFNPEDKEFHVPRGEAKERTIIFNNKKFIGNYRWQDSTDVKKENQGFQYHKDLQDEIKNVFPDNDAYIEIHFDRRNPLEVIIIPVIKESYNIKLLEEDFEVKEGEITEETRKVIKRCNTIIKKAKKNFIREHGSLYCEICGFDFSKVYGELGKDFIEGHHKNPLCERNGQEMTKIDDIALVCSNCHRMLHRKDNMSVESLKNMIQNYSTKGLT